MVLHTENMLTESDLLMSLYVFYLNTVAEAVNSHWAEAFGLQPGSDVLRWGVIGDADGRQVAVAAGWSRELLLSAAAQSQSVHQLVLNLLHVRFPACSSNKQHTEEDRLVFCFKWNQTAARLPELSVSNRQMKVITDERKCFAVGLTGSGCRSLVVLVPDGDAAVVAGRAAVLAADRAAAGFCSRGRQRWRGEPVGGRRRRRGGRRHRRYYRFTGDVVRLRSLLLRDRRGFSS